MSALPDDCVVSVVVAGVGVVVVVVGGGKAVVKMDESPMHLLMHSLIVSKLLRLPGIMAAIFRIQIGPKKKIDGRNICRSLASRSIAFALTLATSEDEELAGGVLVVVVEPAQLGLAIALLQRQRAEGVLGLQVLTGH